MLISNKATDQGHAEKLSHYSLNIIQYFYKDIHKYIKQFVVKFVGWSTIVEQIADQLIVDALSKA